jgi:hypothetical protein
MTHWKRARLAGAAVLLLAAPAAARAQQPAAPEPYNGKLQVIVDYTGTGAVDADHRVWIWVFDNPNIGVDSTPIGTGVVKENKAPYKFSLLPKTVYLAVAYDDKGGYDGTAEAPPPGTPIRIFGVTAPGTTATPVTTGDDEATATVTFDDSVRMP